MSIDKFKPRNDMARGLMAHVAQPSSMQLWKIR